MGFIELGDVADGQNGIQSLFFMDLQLLERLYALFG